jgi:DNA invertase Pin-like site-specific DNA recombinase
MGSMGTRAAIYTRISDDREGQALGVARQERTCRELCAQRGWDVIGVYSDNDVSASAYTRKRRPGYARLLRDIADCQLDAVCYWDQDRLFRRPKEMEEFFEICEAGGVHHLASTIDSIDLSAGDVMLPRIRGAVAAEESRKISARIKAKHRELAEQGKFSGGGNRPFGFEPDRVTLRESEAVLIRDAARRVLAGEGIRGVCADWDANGVTTSAGNRWTPFSLRRMLLSARIAGIRELGDITATAVWPAIVDEQTHRSLVRILTDPNRQKNRAPRRYLLAGMVRCSRCGEKMVARPRADKTRTYICARGPGFMGCGQMRVIADPLEALIIEMVLVALDSRDLAMALQRLRTATDSDVLAGQIAGDEAALAELATDYYAERTISRTEFLAAREAIERRLEGAKRSQAALNGGAALEAVEGQGAVLRGIWATLSLDRRRAVIGAVVDRVTITPAKRGFNRFDPTRVQVTWRY